MSLFFVCFFPVSLVFFSSSAPWFVHPFSAFSFEFVRLSSLSTIFFVFFLSYPLKYEADSEDYYSGNGEASWGAGRLFFFLVESDEEDEQCPLKRSRFVP
ncbi:hypothetical protein NC651_002290 [Populus alba x Populus x berolinensis]|nr:hypothetical protein NC651_002290 [Populus alba x Populus x berolinensis]